jgi:hypothetical protein
MAKWFEAGKPLGWRKVDSASKRRRAALRSRKGDLLATARALIALSNVTKDKMTKALARRDAYFFFDRYRRRK